MQLYSAALFILPQLLRNKCSEAPMIDFSGEGKRHLEDIVNAPCIR
jgi:hypothetical protein